MRTQRLDLKLPFEWQVMEAWLFRSVLVYEKGTGTERRNSFFSIFSSLFSTNGCLSVSFASGSYQNQTLLWGIMPINSWGSFTPLWKQHSVYIIFSLCFQAFFTEKYLQEHPEDQDKIELLKQLIALQVLYWERLGSTVWVQMVFPPLFCRENADKCCKDNLDMCTVEFLF